MIVRLLGLLSLATALYAVRPIWQPHVYAWFNLLSHVHFWYSLKEHFAMAGAFRATISVLIELTIIAKLAVAYGLLRVHSWARPVAIIVLTADFVWRANGAVTAFMLDMMFRLGAFVPATPETPNPDGTVTMLIYLWPSYVIAIISIASVLVLIQKPIKNLFVKSKSLTDKYA